MDKIKFTSQVDKVLDSCGMGHLSYDLIPARRNIFTLKVLVPSKLMVYDEKGSLLFELKDPTKTDLITKLEGLKSESN